MLVKLEGWQKLAVMIISLVLVSGLLFVSGKAEGQEKLAPVKFGAPLPITGKGATYGSQHKVACDLAMEDVNATGGINGSTLEMIYIDIHGDPKEVPIAMTRFIREHNVFAVIGPMASAECETGMPVAKSLECPAIAPSSAAPGLLERVKARPWGFRNMSSEERLFAEGMRVFRKLHPNVKKFAIVVDVKEAWANNLGSKVMPAALKALGYTIVNEDKPITVEQGQTDMSGPVTALKRLNAEAIASGTMYGEGAAFALEMKRQGFQLPAIGGVGWLYPILAKLGGDAVEGYMAVAPGYLDPNNPEHAAILKRFSARSSQVAGYGVSSYYDTVMCTAKILRGAGMNGGTPLQKAREAIKDGWFNLKDYMGISGLTSMDQTTGDTIKQPYVLMVKGGAWVVAK